MQSALCCAMNDHRDSYRSSSQGSEIEALDVRVPLLRLKGSTWDAVALETAVDEGLDQFLRQLIEVAGLAAARVLARVVEELLHHA